MNLRRSCKVIALWLAVIVAAASAAVAQPAFTAIRTSSLPGAPDRFTASSVLDQTTVAGMWLVPDDGQFATTEIRYGILKDGVATAFPLSTDSLSTNSAPSAFDIHLKTDASAVLQIFFSVRGGIGSSRAFAWDGQNLELVRPPGRLAGLDYEGIRVGLDRDGNPFVAAQAGEGNARFSFCDGCADLGFKRSFLASAFAVNGGFVGSARLSPPPAGARNKNLYRAAMLRKGRIISLHSRLPKALVDSSSDALAANGRGQVLVQTRSARRDSSRYLRLFLLRDSGRKRVLELESPYAGQVLTALPGGSRSLGACGQVIASSIDDESKAGEGRAMHYSPATGVEDLNSLVDPSELAGAVLNEAVGIGRDGTILARSYQAATFSTTTFLLIPRLPEYRCPEGSAVD